ncbi:MAG: zinc ribbon domain-containing protein [Clostridia bacterium]|nr:zinc ribbon domain-containing protein [Clostridia bacterium]
MNQPFMFTPPMNPYADNEKFIKKAFSHRLVIPVLIAIGIILIQLVYAVISISNYSTRGTTFAADQEEELLLRIFTMGTVISYVIQIIFFFLVLIAFFILFDNLKNSDAPPLPRAFPTLLRLFLFAALFRSGITVLNTLTTGTNTLLSDSTDTADFLSSDLASLLMEGLPALLTFLWALSALILIRSFVRTTRAMGLFPKGARAYIVMSRLFAASQLALGVIYYINHFSGGIFSVSDGEVSYTAEWLRSDGASAIMFVVYYAAAAAAVLFTSLFAKAYYKAVRSAERTIQANGTNMYMNGTGYASVYYNQPYAAPQPVNNAPPIPVQPGFDSPPSAYTAVPPVYSSFEVQQPPAEISCPACGTLNAPSCRFCISCGNKLMNNE